MGYFGMGFSNVRLADYKHNNAGFGISAGKLGSIVIENCKLKIPVPRSGIWPAPVAQLVEQLPLKEKVLGSSPRGCTKFDIIKRNCGISTVVVRYLAKVKTPVRFRYPAQDGFN